jgi:5'(3')-deoxyribonucleotidase
MMVKGLIDLDNVVSDWISWVMSKQTEIPKMEGLRSGKLQDMWPGLTDEDVDRIVQDIRGYTKAELISGASNGLWALAYEPDIDFIYLSAAPKSAVDGRRQWMLEQGLPISEMNGVLHLLHLDDSKGKVDWIMDHGCEYDFILDDGLAYLDAALMADIPLRIAYDHPWNKDDGNHERVFSWLEAVEKIRALIK